MIRFYKGIFVADLSFHNKITTLLAVQKILQKYTKIFVFKNLLLYIYIN
jgi:hypothetical protein